MKFKNSCKRIFNPIQILQFEVLKIIVLQIALILR